ncbi:Replication-relaxation [Paenibacillus sp. UNC496MF]|uniref:replication-relaxation family protein n=1 Tax=Paenibacillus sp. UNC496MF TaxID=1502753 RepID=UPI0008E20813|nr:replication-relaxation family protein [Paenibacillus sp. UNC496MF]SFJ77206.1 Replication-relaxation [Paenibacillus sp. UNC496MF]
MKGALEHVPTSGEGKKRKVRTPGESSFGSVVDRLSSRDWRFLIDLYICRCMPISVAVEHYFWSNPVDDPDYARSSRDKQEEMHAKSLKSAKLRTQRKLFDLYAKGVLEKSNALPDELDKAPKLRTRVKGETWYYLTTRGLRLVEMRIGVLEESKLSKLELDLERAKKEHFWELAKVYLELKYKQLEQIGAKQFIDWDWYPSLSILGNKDFYIEVRPDAVFRLDEQVFYIELDRSTEPVQRSPFVSARNQQVSIENKLQRYKQVMHYKDAPLIQKNGIIAFIVPEARYEARLNNIRAAAKTVFKGFDTQVFVGRTIGDVLSQRFAAAGRKDG